MNCAAVVSRVSCDTNGIRVVSCGSLHTHTHPSRPEQGYQWYSEKHTKDEQGIECELLSCKIVQHTQTHTHTHTHTHTPQAISRLPPGGEKGRRERDVGV